ncbi:hypothetical protein DPMN_096216 [Dreissena polymorpha]|uniref:Uncharacterized protein n=1 Tax=Dreissena polymorpha TaxID=45954 RepID=A0A9D4L9G8_DREPO|nr:hypothetical protein DPMN_096216 [Dreissena polymorpha]
MIRLKCGYDGKQSYQDFYVVDSPSSPILGLDTCMSMNLMMFQLFTHLDVFL